MARKKIRPKRTKMLKRKYPAQAITAIRRQFKRKPEWLLIRVAKMDTQTTTPLTGWLLAHDPDRDVIFQKSIHQHGLILVDHSREKLPSNYAVAF